MKNVQKRTLKLDGKIGYTVNEKTNEIQLTNVPPEYNFAEFYDFPRTDFADDVSFYHYHTLKRKHQMDDFASRRDNAILNSRNKSILSKDSLEKQFASMLELAKQKGIDISKLLK